MRIHAAHRCDLYLRVRSHPIIEHSTTLRFAPYAASYGGSEGDLADQGLEPDGGMWSQASDGGARVRCAARVLQGLCGPSAHARGGLDASHHQRILVAFVPLTASVSTEVLLNTVQVPQ